MAAIGPVAFAALLWGGLLGLAAVLVYEAYAIVADAGRVGGR